MKYYDRVCTCPCVSIACLFALSGCGWGGWGSAASFWVLFHQPDPIAVGSKASGQVLRKFKVAVLSAVVNSPWKLSTFLSRVWLTKIFSLGLLKARLTTVFNFSVKVWIQGPPGGMLVGAKHTLRGALRNKKKTEGGLLWVLPEVGVSSGGIFTMSCWWSLRSVSC